MVRRADGSHVVGGAAFRKWKDGRAQLGGMVWIVAALTMPRPVPGSEEPWATQCEASQDTQSLEGGVRAQIPS